MFKSLLSSLFRSLGATVIEKGSSVLVDKLAPKDGEDFAEAPKVRVKRKLPQMYLDELAKLEALKAVDLTRLSTGMAARHLQSIDTVQARVNMYKARLDAQAKGE